MVLPGQLGAQIVSALAQQLADSLEAEGRKTLDFFRDLAPGQWEVQVYADGPAWKVHDLLAHFTEVEGSILRLVHSVIKGSSGVAEDFSVDRWNAEHTAELSPQNRESLLDEFANRRAITVALVRELSDADLEKRGRHPFLGDTEIKHMVRLMYLHLQGHQRDIRRALKAAASN